ncbi:MAG TPA: N-acetyltransferase [Burkholderiaceae bacterium]|nr:N-acetyltransferase [Burkholderiaceae bacterium]
MGASESLVDARLVACTPEGFREIATWIADADACIRWAGPKPAFPLIAEQLAETLEATEHNSFELRGGDGRLLGFGQVRTRPASQAEPGAAHLARIIVAPAARGRGVGACLVRLLMRHARESLAARACTLRVYRDNAAAVALYQKLGFVEIDDPDATSDVPMMRATLAPAGSAPAGSADRAARRVPA